MITDIPDSPAGAVEVYPNPVRDKKFLIGFERNPGIVEIVIYDALGRPVFSSRQVVDGNYALEVSPGLTDGLYILIIKTDATSVQRRLLIRH